METLLLFAKAPIAGACKTRIAQHRGDDAAARLATAFLQDTAALCDAWRRQQLAADLNRKVVVYAAVDAAHPALLAAAERCAARIEAQQGEDLGARLQHAFHAEYERGARSVLAIGSDSPTLPLPLLDEAFRALLWERVVVGPTFDGGYWCVGAQRPAPELFHGVPWSTNAVLTTTLDKLRAARVPTLLLPFWYDVDTVDDLERLSWHVRALRTRDPRACQATWSALVEVGGGAA